MWIVSGANGKLGSLIVEQLLARVPASSLGVSVREPEKAQAFAARGVRVRRGDFDDPASLTESFAGATQVLVISASAIGEVALRRHRNAIEAAKAAGAQRIVYTSHMGANHQSEFAPMRAHAATEDLLRACGVPFLSLRNGFYASTAAMLLGQGLGSGQLVAPADGPVSWTTHADLAAAAVLALTEPERFGPYGISPPLTAGQAYDLAGVAALATAALGRPITRMVAPDDAYRAQLGSRMPEPQADMLMGMFRASRAGEFAAVDGALATLLGRPAQTVRDVLPRPSST